MIRILYKHHWNDFIKTQRHQIKDKNNLMMRKHKRYYIDQNKYNQSITMAPNIRSNKMIEWFSVLN